ncbi:MAG: NUDIX hydrolase [Patescibacteria group bacterium]
MQKVFSASKAIIKKGNKFLIINEHINGKICWDIPGGKIEYKETPQETVKREVKEELGITVKVIKHLGVFWFFKMADNKQVICNTYLCEPKSTKFNFSNNPAKDEEITGYEWVTKKEFIKKYFKHFNKSIKEIIDNI